MKNWLTRAKPKAETEQRQFKQWQVQWVRKPRARALSLQLRAEGSLRVTSPKGLEWTFVEQFLKSKASWIEKHQEKFDEFQIKNPTKKLKADEKYLFLGEELKLRYLPTPLKQVFFSKSDFELRMHLPEILFQNLKEEELEKYFPELKKFYRREAVKFLTERIMVWAHEMNLHPRKLSFRSQKTRWGSCTSAGHISMNLKLITAPLFVIDSVLIHELAHLKHMNHSKDFWALAESFDPSVKAADQWLKEQHPGMRFLD